MTSEKASTQTREQQETLLNAIIDKMNELYRCIDPEGNMILDSIFTSKNVVYSGSEATVFHLVKLLALQAITEHSFPIIIDSFRAEDLSTGKESIVINLAKELSNHIYPMSLS